MDSIYSQIDPDNLYSYLDVFIQDAQRNGVDLSYVYEGCYSLRLAPPSFVDIEFAGYASRKCYDDEVLITINEDDWKQSIEFWDNSYPIAIGFHLMYHELGHDILNLGHTCNETPNFLNHPSECDGSEDFNTDKLKNPIDLLWFTNNEVPELSEDNIGFHKTVNNYFNKINQNISEWVVSIDWSNPTAENSIPCPIPYQWTDWNGQERGLINKSEDQKCKFN